MPKGTPICLKCPKCKRGKWREARMVEGCAPTGRIEAHITKSKHGGRGDGGHSFTGHRGQVECRDCGYTWFSTLPWANGVECSGAKPCWQHKGRFA